MTMLGDRVKRTSCVGLLWAERYQIKAEKHSPQFLLEVFPFHCLKAFNQSRFNVDFIHKDKYL